MRIAAGISRGCLYLVGAVLIGLPICFIVSIFYVKAARSS
jgi:hypothetical protein